MTELTSQSPYRVLARKYRPQTFDDLIGQKALVTTLTNAFKLKRLAHAFILTGVRGVGKTTTARLIAKAINCLEQNPESENYPNPCGKCDSCLSISEDRHVDVMEMDAASRTSVDDIREILASVAYKPVSSEFKIYIIDEVHMLSKQAFNALLKTLEEPPEHVKFIFATTEIRRVPITVLSRCQRFDLRRVEIDELKKHLNNVSTKEGFVVEEQGLDLLARAADGSVRDGLSILDQALAQSSSNSSSITGTDIQNMLGLADRTKMFELIDFLFSGDIKNALNLFKDLYSSGADPLTILQDLSSIVHSITKLKITPSYGDSLPEIDKVRGLKVSEKLSVPTLCQSWNILLKGIKDIQTASHPFTAAEMLFIRFTYLAETPDFSKIVNPSLSETNLLASGKSADEGASSSLFTQQQPSQSPSYSGPTNGPTAHALNVETISVNEPAIGIIPNSFEDIIALCEEKKEVILQAQLTNDVRLVSYQQGKVEISLTDTASETTPNKLLQFLNENTQKKWIVSVAKSGGRPTLREEKEIRIKEQKERLLKHPLVQSIKTAFPSAEIVQFKPKQKD